MKSWKDVPQLFANGKFQISISDYTGIENDIWKFEGVISKSIFLERGHYEEESFEHFQTELENCNLIARRIENMSNEESKQFDELEEEMNLGRWYFPHPECFFFLLDKGIYPFDQSHFDTGEVIDINTLEK